MPPPDQQQTVLVVDDDLGLTRLIARELRRNGYQTATAGSADEAMSWLAGHHADLLLLDLKLPGMEGNAFLEAMAGAGHAVPFAIITGQGDERVAVDMMKRGAVDYLVKDVNFIDLLPTLVARALGQITQKRKLAEAEAALARSHADLEQQVIARTAELTRANADLHEARRFAEATIEAVPASLAVLDEKGVIISTNKAWLDFAVANGGLSSAVATGVNYLAVCDAAASDEAEGAAAFASGIREVISGASSQFSLEYPCHAPDQQRWFVGYVTAFPRDGAARVVIAHVDISARKRAEQVIRRLNDELELRVEERTAELSKVNVDLREQIAIRRQLEAEILHISEREQQRIGQDLHDDLGQQLAGTWLLSEVLKKNLIAQGSAEAANAEQINGLLKNALSLTRSLARGLHPVAVQVGGLVAALDELTARTCDLFHVDCVCHCPPHVEMDNTVATHLYRIAQEAVTNAVKHGKARHIAIELSSNLHSTVLSIKDQGTGFMPGAEKTAGMGQRIMRYRADIIGGVLDIQSGKDGTNVVCTIPTPTPTPTPTPAPSTPAAHGQEESSSTRGGSTSAGAEKEGVHR